jgi:two-component system OmpR family response regulator
MVPLMMSSMQYVPKAHTDTAVLAVDDDADTARLLSDYLRDFGMNVEVAQTGAQMRDFLGRRQFDIVLLDLMLPDEPGMDLCSWSKQSNPGLPVILLTADDDAESCIQGLGRGADDYVGKPFRARELVARIRAVLRRTTEAGAAAAGDPRSSLRHDLALRRFTSDGVTIALTELENRLLAALLERPGVVLSRSDLLDLMHAPGVDLSDRNVDAAISNIRAKLGDQRTLIGTVRGEGYLLQLRPH